jgi:hypothetical protein
MFCSGSARYSFPFRLDLSPDPEKQFFSLSNVYRRSEYLKLELGPMNVREGEGREGYQTSELYLSFILLFALLDLIHMYLLWGTPILCHSYAGGRNKGYRGRA